MKIKKNTKTVQRTHEIENFIGVYDNYILPQECDRAIKIFDNQHKFNNTLDRLKFENSGALSKKDNQFFANKDNMNVWWQEYKTMIANYDMAFKHYSDTTGAMESFGADYYYTDVKLQKTLPTEGYHIWHVEHGLQTEGANDRAFVFTIYLNDVKEGGETEFLHFSKRVKPKKGRIVIWPASFPYVHRGNPPISGEKYILTSWMKLKP